MKQKTREQSYQTQPCNEVEGKDRRHATRRSCEKKGFAYIPMVGWMCRREKARRKDDDICGW